MRGASSRCDRKVGPSIRRTRRRRAKSMQISRGHVCHEQRQARSMSQVESRLIEGQSDMRRGQMHAGPPLIHQLRPRRTEVALAKQRDTVASMRRLQWQTQQEQDQQDQHETTLLTEQQQQQQQKRKKPHQTAGCCCVCERERKDVRNPRLESRQTAAWGGGRAPAVAGRGPRRRRQSSSLMSWTRSQSVRRRRVWACRRRHERSAWPLVPVVPCRVCSEGIHAPPREFDRGPRAGANGARTALGEQRRISVESESESTAPLAECGECACWGLERRRHVGVGCR